MIRDVRQLGKAHFSSISFFLVPPLALSLDIFYDPLIPSYCSEMDKNNTVMWPAGVSSEEVLGALGSGVICVSLGLQTKEGSLCKSEPVCQGVKAGQFSRASLSILLY